MFRGLFGVAHFSRAVVCAAFFLSLFVAIIFTFILFTYSMGRGEQCAEDGLRNMFSCLVVQFCRLLHSKGKNLFNAAQFDSAANWQQQQQQQNGTKIAMNISLFLHFH